MAAFSNKVHAEVSTEELSLSELDQMLWKGDEDSKRVASRGKKAVVAAILALALAGASVMILGGGSVSTTTSDVASSSIVRLSSNALPCECTPNGTNWTVTSRTTPKCIFIDLGANKADSFQYFLDNRYGKITDECPGDDWEAWLWEANPEFTKDLENAEADYPGQVHPLPSTAAFFCNGTATFSIDPDGRRAGSSLNRSIFANGGGALKQITVPTININQFIAEHAIPEDYVILKVDIEGAEYNILTCLARSASARLIDALYVEEHPQIQPFPSVYTPAQYNAAKAKLKDLVPYMPHYSTWSRL